MLSKQELEAQVKAKINQDFQAASNLENYLLQTLNNFGHRYFTGEAKASIEGHNHFSIEYLETRMAQALKTNDSTAHKGIKELARAVPVKKTPTVLNKIELHILEISGVAENTKGCLEITSVIDWEWPAHRRKKESSVERKKRLDFEDFFELRNNLPRHLETLCQLF